MIFSYLFPVRIAISFDPGQAALGLLDVKPEGIGASGFGFPQRTGCSEQATPRQRLWHPTLARELARLEELGDPGLSGVKGNI